MLKVGGRAPRIVLEHSGYDLLNIGDVAMLVACYERVRSRWPDAVVHVPCYRPEVLQEYCPGAIPLEPPLRDMPGIARLPRRARLGGEQVFKTISPFLPALPGTNPDIRRAWATRDAVRQADAVIATGGGYLCDKFWWHALGVASTLSAGQWRGLVTAAFGQGIGPLNHGSVRAVLGWVLRRLHVLTLREGRMGGPVLSAMGVVDAWDRPTRERPCVTGRRGTRVVLSGDEAIGIARRGVVPQAELVVGFNVRLGTDSDLSRPEGIAEAVLAAASQHGASVLTLPVSRYDTQDDDARIRELLESASIDSPRPQVICEPIGSPRELAERASRCSVVVTGSYHAAVFSLAVGCPVVMLVANDYYTQKSSGLSDLYPGMLQVVRVNEADQGARLGEAIDRAFLVDAGARATAREDSWRYEQLAQDAFDWFADLVDARLRRDEGTRPASPRTS